MDLKDHIIYTKVDIGRNLLIIRKAQKISHSELVGITGLTRPILSTIENASANPTLETLLKLSSALNISNDMLFMSKDKFEQLKFLLKDLFGREKTNQFEYYIPPRSWKMLMQYSGDETKKNCSRVAKICAEIVHQNNGKSGTQNNMILGATLGVIFQDDGFKYGLEFGAWLGNKLKSQEE